MDTLLNRLYYGQINEAEQNPKVKQTGKELETYVIAPGSERCRS